MQPSSTFCRTQEALQHGRAADATLDNIRCVATAAAAAWGKEAIAAERREERLERTRAEARASSENPDRGFADAEAATD